MKHILSLFAAGLVSLPLMLAAPATASADLVSELIGKRWQVTGRVNGSVIYNPDGSAQWRNRWGLRGNGEWRKRAPTRCACAGMPFRTAVKAVSPSRRSVPTPSTRR